MERGNTFQASRWWRAAALAALLLVVFLSFGRALALEVAFVRDAGDILVLEAEGPYDADFFGEETALARQQVTRAFYAHRPDEFDFIVIFTNFDFRMPKEEVLAFYNHVRNNVEGIGKELFDFSGQYGSAGRLQGTIDMGALDKMAVDPMDKKFSLTMTTLSHEFLHRWAAYVSFRKPGQPASKALIGREDSHWSFLLDSRGSVQCGNLWQANGDGTFTSKQGQKYYSPLDLYLMGLVSKEQVPPMILIQNDQVDPNRLPEPGVTIEGTAQTVTIDDIIAAEGPRLPDAAHSQKEFRLGCILLVRPDTFDPADLDRVRSVMHGWVPWFAALTDGRAVVRFDTTVFDSLPENPSIDDPEAAARPEPPQVSGAVQWLVAHQQASGAWGDDPRTLPRDTAEAVLALSMAGGRAEAVAAGTKWMDGYLPENNDYLARKIQVLALPGTDPEQAVQQLLSRQNTDGGWGAQEGFASNPLDTALAATALVASGIDTADSLDRAVAFLAAGQQPNGSWNATDQDHTVRDTAMVLHALGYLQQRPAAAACIPAGLGWLMDRQQADGGFGAESSTVYETALCLLATTALKAPADARSRAVNYLLAQQAEDDSWYGSVYQTALAVRALYATNDRPDLAVQTADIDLSPAAISHFPQAMTLTATVANRGLVPATGAVVALYADGIQEADKVAEKVLDVPAESSATVSFDFVIKKGGFHRYWLVADPDDAIAEIRETNNLAIKQIQSNPSYDFAVTDAELEVSPASVQEGQPVSMAVSVVNRGTRPAFSLPVSFFVGSGPRRKLAASTKVDLPPAGRVRASVQWIADQVGRDMAVAAVVDPDNAFAELDETNNQANGILTVLGDPRPDVHVAAADILLEPQSPLQGQAATVRVTVSNRGGSEARDVSLALARHRAGMKPLVINTVTIPSLQAGQSRQVAIAWPEVRVKDRWLVDVIADPDNRLDESDESNNAAFVLVDIVSLPDLAVDAGSIRLDPGAPSEGQLVQVTVTVRNEGGQRALNVPLVLEDAGGIVDSATLAGIDAHSHQAAVLHFDTTGRPGARTLTVRVNPQAQVREQDLNNNVARRTVGVQNADLWLSDPVMTLAGAGGQGGTSFSFRLPNPADVQVVVVDSYGQTVRVFSGPELKGTSGTTIFWDGRDDDGHIVPDGSYQIQVIGPYGQLLAMLPVVVDNNLSSLAEAMGSRYLAVTNLTCSYPGVIAHHWLSDDSALVVLLDKAPDNGFAEPALYTVSPDGGRPVRITPTAFPDPDAGSFAYRPADLGKDYFIVAPETNRVLFAVNKEAADGKIWQTQLWAASPWGRDAVLVDRLVQVQPDGQPAPVSEHLLSPAACSPDGKTLAYLVEKTDSAAGTSQLQLRLVPTTGGQAASLALDGWRQADRILWSPDARRLAVTAWDGGTRIAVWDGSGAPADLYTVPQDRMVDTLAWLDATHLLLVDKAEDDKARTPADPLEGFEEWGFDRFGQWSVTILDAAAGTAREVEGLQEVERIRQVAISPAGGRFALIYRTTAVRQNGGDAYLGWQPGFGYWKVDLCDNQGNRRTVYKGRFANCPWFFLTQDDINDSMGELAWSPDGRRLAFADYLAEAVDSCTYRGRLLVIDAAGNQAASLPLERANFICIYQAPWSFHIFSRPQPGTWMEQGVMHFGPAMSTRRLDLDPSALILDPESGDFRLRIQHVGTRVAELDAVALLVDGKAYAPARATTLGDGNDITPEVVGLDYGKADVAAKTVELVWQGLEQVLKQAAKVALSLCAREADPVSGGSGPDNPAEAPKARIHRLALDRLAWMHDGAWIMAADEGGSFFLNWRTGERRQLSVDALGLAHFGKHLFGHRLFSDQDGKIRIDSRYDARSARNYLVRNGLEENRYIVNKDAAGVYFTGSRKNYVPYAFKLSPSPRSSSLAYQESLGEDSACATIGGRGKACLWTVHNLLNLAADLRLQRQEDGILLRGTACDANLAEYRLEYADLSRPDRWQQVRVPGRDPVINDVFCLWVPPYPGTFDLRLTVTDQAGHSIQRVRRTSWGLAFPVTDFQLAERYFSPNGDGVKDTVTLSYVVRQPINMAVHISDAYGRPVRTVHLAYPDLPPDEGKASFSWDGKDDEGRFVDDGTYRIEVLGYTFQVVVDTRPPQVAIELSKFGMFDNFAPFSSTCQERAGLDLDPPPAMTGVMAWSRAEDENQVEWQLEYANAFAPDNWQKLPPNAISLPKPSDCAPAGMTDARWIAVDSWRPLKGARFRIRAWDKAGNCAVAISETMEPVLALVAWKAISKELRPQIKPALIQIKPKEDGSLGTLGAVDEESWLKDRYIKNRYPMPMHMLRPERGAALMAVCSHDLPADCNLQFWDAEARQWIDGPVLPHVKSGYFALEINPELRDLAKVSRIRLHAVLESGEDIFSNEIKTVAGFGVGFSCEVSSYLCSVNLAQNIQRLVFGVKKRGEKERPVRVWDVKRGDLIPYEDFSIPYRVAELGRGDTYWLRAWTNRGDRFYSQANLNFPPISLELNCPEYDLSKVKLCLPGEKLSRIRLFIEKEDGSHVLVKTWDGSPGNPIHEENKFSYPPAGLEEGDLLFADAEDLDGNHYETGRRSIKCGGLDYRCSETGEPVYFWEAYTAEKPVYLEVAFEKPDGSIVVDRRWDAGLGDTVPRKLALWQQEDWPRPDELEDGDVLLISYVTSKATTRTIRGQYSSRNYCASLDLLIDKLPAECGQTAGKVLLETKTNNSVLHSEARSVRYQLLQQEKWETLCSRSHPDDLWQPCRFDPGRRNSDGSFHFSEGSHKVRSIVVDAKGKSYQAENTIVIDHKLPAVHITGPGNGQVVCPRLKGSQWSIDVYGIVDDNLGVEKFHLAYAYQSRPNHWKQIDFKEGAKISVLKKQLKPVYFAGLLGTASFEPLADSNILLRLEVVDKGGNTACDTVECVIQTDQPLKLGTDSHFISPNGDGALDELKIRVAMESRARLDAEVWAASGKVRTLATDMEHEPGITTLVWDGTGDAGGRVIDGTYSIVVKATGSCGTVQEQRLEDIVVDTAAPQVVVHEPEPGKPLGTVVDIIGTVKDQHLSEYSLELLPGEGKPPEKVLADGTAPVERRLLATLNTYGMRGQRVLRLAAGDKAGNKAAVHVPLDLENRLWVIRSLDVQPRWLSPNADGSHDRTAVSFEINKELAGPFEVTLEIGDGTGRTVRSFRFDRFQGHEGSFSWDGTDAAGQTVPDGAYTVRLTAVVTDQPALRQSEQTGVVVDTTAPHVAIAQPAGGSFVNQAVVVRGSLSDANLDSYTAWVKDGAGRRTLETGNVNRTDWVFGIADLADGPCSVSIQAEDLAGNKTLATADFIVDTARPVVSLRLPENGRGFGADQATVTVDGTVTEPNLEKWQVRVRPATGTAAGWQVLAEGDQPGPVAVKWLVGKSAGVADGPWQVQLTARDKAGWKADTLVHVVVDNNPPEAAIASPAAGAFVTGPVTISGTADDANLVAYRLWWTTDEPGDTARWTPIGKKDRPVRNGKLADWHALCPDGPATVRLEVEDRLGNKTRAQVQVVVDTHPPAAPTLSGQVVDNRNADLQWAGAGEPDVAGFILLRDGKPLVSDPVKEPFYLDTDVPEGTHTYQVVAVDRAGWQSPPSAPLALVFDRTPPSVAIIEPTQAKRVCRKVDIRGTAFSDDFGSWRLRAGIGAGPDKWRVLAESTLPVASGLLVQWDTTGLPEATEITLELEAVDRAGNKGTSRVTVVVDNKGPAAPVLLDLQAGGAGGNDVTATWEPVADADLAGYIVFRNDEPVTCAAGQMSDPGTCLVSGTSLTDSGLPDGSHGYHVVAVDSAGNWSPPSNRLTVVIDTRAPRAVITAPAEGMRFDQPQAVTASCPDLDVTSVQLQYRADGGAGWIDLGPALQAPPWIGRLDPIALGLAYGSYRLRAVATDAGGRSDTDPAEVQIYYQDITPPEPPGVPLALADGGRIKVQWPASGADDLAGYNLYLLKNGSWTKVNEALIEQTDFLLKETDGDLADGNYYLRVTAVDTSANESAPSGEAMATVFSAGLEQPYTPLDRQQVTVEGQTTALATVQILRLDGGTTTVVAEVAADENGRFSTPVSLVDGPNRLLARAVDPAGNRSKPSSQRVVVRAQAPAVPTGLAGQADGHDVLLDWEANTEADLGGYHLYRDGRKVNEDGPVPIDQSFSATAGTAAWSADDAIDGRTYTGWEASLDAGAQWWMMQLPDPMILTRIDLCWADNMAARDFVLQAWTGYGWLDMARVKFNDPEPVGEAGPQNSFVLEPAYATDRLRLVITRGAEDERGSGRVRLCEVRLWRQNPIVGESYRDRQLDDGTYAYRLAAVNIHGMQSQPCEPVQVSVGDVTPPGPPVNLVATAHDASVHLAWQPPVDGDVAGYRVFRLDGRQWIVLAEELVPQPVYDDPNLANGTYTYRVVAVDGAGNQSPPSNEAQATVGVELPGRPTNVTATSLPQGRTIEVCWEAVAGAAGYRLYRASDPGGPFEAVFDTPINDTCYLDTGLIDGLTYFYRVRAVDAAGNEGADSQQAQAMAEDRLAPPAPVIFQPTVARRPVSRTSGKVDLVGWAEPGAWVDAWRNGRQLGTGRAAEEDVWSALSVQADGATIVAWAVSPDGRWLALSEVNEEDETGDLRLIDLEGGSVQLLGAFAPGRLCWSPDSGRLAFVFSNSSGRQRIGLVDPADGGIRTLPEKENGDYDELAPFWQDADRLLVATDRRGDGFEVLRYDLGDGSLTPVLQLAARPTAISLSPDGRQLAWTVVQSGRMALYRCALDGQGQPEQVAPDIGERPSGPVPFDWRSDGGLLFLAADQQGSDVYAVAAGTATAEPVTDRHDVADFVVMPGGRHLVCLVAEEGRPPRLEWIDTADDQAQRVLDEEGIGQADGMQALAGGDLVVRDDSRWLRLSPAGRFTFAAVSLEVDDNLFGAAARDASGNQGPNAEPVLVQVDGAALADLVVRAGDLQMVPYVPTEGETVHFSVQVHNDGFLPARQVPVQASVWTARGGLETLLDTVVEGIDPGQAQILSFDWSTAGRPGKAVVVVEADGIDRIFEADEDNNAASIELIVTGAQPLSLTAYLDADSYKDNQDVSVTVEWSWRQAAFDGHLEVAVEDAAGHLIAPVHDGQVRVEYSPLQKVRLGWNTGRQPAGDYWMACRLFNGTDLMAEHRLPFAIESTLGLRAQVGTDRLSYGLAPSVGIHTILVHEGGNRTLEDAVCQVTVADESGQAVFEAQTDPFDLAAGQSIEQSLAWEATGVLPGRFQVTAAWWQGAEQLARAQSAFTIEQVVDLDGSLDVVPARVEPGESATVSYTLINRGNVPTAGMGAAVVLLDQEGGERLRFDLAPDLAPGRQGSDSLVLDTSGLAPGRYQLRLQYEGADGRPVQVATASLVVAGDQAGPVHLSGQLTVSPERVEPAEPVLISYQVLNESEMDLEDLELAVRLTSQAGDICTESVVLPLRQILQGDCSIVTDRLEIGTYTVVLEARSRLLADPLEVARGRFTVGPPPIDVHPPTAEAGGPYLATTGEPVWVDGSASFDVDEGTSQSGRPPFDTITSYDWETGQQEPFDFDEGSGARALLKGFCKPGNYTLRLRVTDNTAAAFPDAGLPDLTGVDTAELAVFKRGRFHLCGWYWNGNVWLWWYNNGACGEEIWRSSAGPNHGYVKVADSGCWRCLHLFWMDRQVEPDKQYWYRIKATCGQKVWLSRPLRIHTRSRWCQHANWR